MAHIWDGADTLCQLVRTKRLDLENYEQVDAMPDSARSCFQCAKRQQDSAAPRGEPGRTLSEPRQREEAAHQALLEARREEQRTFEAYVAAVASAAPAAPAPGARCLG